VAIAAPGTVGSAERGAGERRAFPRGLIGILVLGGVAEFALLALWQRNGYWDFSDGVYAQSARQFLHGLVPYRDFAAAQPPPIYLTGTLLLAVHDGLASVRVGMAALDLATAVLVGVSVWRLCGNRWAAVAAAGLAPLVPITLHEHAQLTPETLAAPLVFGGALCCARPARTILGGALLGLAALCKLAFVVPALAVVLVAPARRKALASLVVTDAVLSTLSIAVFGTGVWREAVQAQLDVGGAPLHYAGGLLAQGAWSECALVVGAGAALLLAWRDPGVVDEPALLRSLGVAAGAGLLIALTVLKRGSYINVLAVADPPLLALAACGATLGWRRRRSWRPVVVGLGALLAVESLSLLVSPGDPWAAKRPGARSGLAWSASPASVDREADVASRCPASVAYSGTPYVAFLATRRMPGDQPDLFMLQARANSRFAKRAAADEPRCPGA
jgi:hypothetical protein